MESLKCPWCNSGGQQCSGSLKLQGAYSTDGVYYGHLPTAKAVGLPEEG